MYRPMFKLSNMASDFHIVHIFVTVDIRQYFVLRCMYIWTVSLTHFSYLAPRSQKLSILLADNLTRTYDNMTTPFCAYLNVAE